MRSNNETASRQNLENPSILKKDRDQVLWARETEHPTQTLVFTKSAERSKVILFDIFLHTFPLNSNIWALHSLFGFPVWGPDFDDSQGMTSVHFKETGDVYITIVNMIEIVHST